MEPEARNSAVGWHWNTHILSFILKQDTVFVMYVEIHGIGFDLQRS